MLGTIADQVDEFELAIAGMANDPAMDVAGAPELLGRDGYCARRDVTSSSTELTSPPPRPIRTVP